MIRIGSIATLILAILLGTIGLPAYAHTCRMLGATVAAPTCGVCDARMDMQEEKAEPKGSSSCSHCNPSAKGAQKTGEEVHLVDPCCSTQTELRHNDTTPMPTSGVALLPLATVTFVLPFAITLSDPIAVSAAPHVAHSPPLEERSQRSWLFNSSFLI